MKKYSKSLLFLGIIVLVLWHYDLGRYFSLVYVKSQLDVWLALMQQNVVLVASIFFVIFVLITAVSIPGALVMTLLAGALFGFVWGVVLVSFASTLGATLSFLTARFLLRSSIASKFSTQFEKINKGVEKDGAFYLFALRLIPIIPFFVINAVMGLTRMRLGTYVVVSQLGMLAGTCVYINIGRNLASIESVSGLLSARVITSFAIFAVIPILSKKIIDIIRAHRVYKAFKPQKPKKFDVNVAIIGAGSGGLIASYIATILKARVALFEKSQMSSRCVPSKTIISINKYASTHKDSKLLGIEYIRPSPRIFFTKVMKAVHENIDSTGSQKSIECYKKLGIEYIQEEARITSPWEVTTKTHTVKARSIIIASGAIPSIPNIPGLREAEPFTSDTIWSLKKQPYSLLVLGGGSIGCEIAYAFALLGSSVTVVERAEQILHKEDTDVAAIAQKSLERLGVTVLTQSTLREIKKSTIHKSKKYKGFVESTAGVESLTVSFDTMLVATGRTPCTQGLGLEDVGVKLHDNGSIDTDEYLRTSIPTIYAVGDVAGNYQFTHAAEHMVRCAAINALFGKIKKCAVDYRVMPSVTFLSPEIARVGLTEKQAREKGLAYEVTKYEMKELDRAIAERKTEGFIKVLTPPKKDTILGAAVICERAGEILSVFTLAMKHGIGLNKILDTAYPYPTFIEGAKACAVLWKKAHTPQKLLSLMGRFLRMELKQK